MNIIKQLETIGFNKKQAKIYLACLELGMATVQDIAKKSGLNRTTTYRLVSSLQERGLISSLIKDNKNLYIAEDVESLKKDFEFRQTVFKDLIPQLRAIAQVLPTKPKIKYFEGEENIKKIVLATTDYRNSRTYSWFSYDIILHFYGQQFANRYVKQRLQNRIYNYMITNKSPVSQRYKNKDQQELRQIKFYKNPQTKFDVDIYLYGDKQIAFINYKSMIALTIESQEIYQMMKIIFMSNWEAL